MIDEKLGYDEINAKKELRLINRKYEEITMRLSLQYHERLECCVLMLGKQLLELENINEKCCRHIRELSTEVNRLGQELCKDATVMMNATDGRKKAHDGSTDNIQDMNNDSDIQENSQLS